MNHYKMLGVHKYSTDGEVKVAYSALASQLHPDKTNNDPEKSARMADINVAYNVLKTPAKRKDYDVKLSLGLYGKACNTCGGKAVSWRQKGFNKRIAVPCTSCGGSGVME